MEKSKKFYVFTVSRHASIISRFEHVCDASDGVNTFLGSQFETKDDCLQFAEEINKMKCDLSETQFTIHCTCDPCWNLFVHF